MSGHSKWSKVKHQKEASDVTKGKIFTKLANAITIGVKQGGGIVDTNSNIKLRLAIEKAKEFNMPKEKIAKAIERGTGSAKENDIEEVVYEAFGPQGVGIIIETTTENNQRTVANIKNTLERNNGRLGSSGSVSYLFEYVGMIKISKNGKSFENIMQAAIDSGAQDIEDGDEAVEIFTTPRDLHKVKEALIKIGLSVTSAKLYYRPKTTIAIQNSVIAKQILSLIHFLEELEEVQKVYANCDIAAGLLQ